MSVPMTHILTAARSTPRFRVAEGRGLRVQELSLDETARHLLGRPLPIPFVETEHIPYKVLHLEYQLPHEICMEIQLMWRMVHMMEYRRVIPTWPRFATLNTVARTIAPLYVGLQHEVFRIFFLDKKRKVLEVIGVEGVSNQVALPDQEMAHIVEYVRSHPEVRGVMLAHNHPWTPGKPEQYRPTPSNVDERLTHMLASLLAPFEVAVLDHLIVTTLRDPKNPEEWFDVTFPSRALRLGIYSMRSHEHSLT